MLSRARQACVFDGLISVVSLPEHIQMCSVPDMFLLPSSREEEVSLDQKECKGPKERRGNR